VNFNKFEGKEDEERKEKDKHRGHRGTEIHRGRI
jgi:hypothetical protein